MNIVVSFKKIWGKELFYPISDDAFFITKLTGRPTILKKQLRLCREAGWTVSIEHKQISLEEE